MKSNIFSRFPHLTLSIITGPQNTDKGRLLDNVLFALDYEKETRDSFLRVLVHTTNPNLHTGFVAVSREEFISLKKSERFAEYNCTGDYWYGVSVDEIQRVFARDKHGVMMVNIEAAIALKTLFGDEVYTIFCQTEQNQLDARKSDFFNVVFTCNTSRDTMHVEYIATAITERAYPMKPEPLPVPSAGNSAIAVHA